MVISLSSSRKLEIFSSGALSVCSGPLEEYESVEGHPAEAERRKIEPTLTETLLSLKLQTYWSSFVNACFCGCCCLVILAILSAVSVSDDTQEPTLSEAIINEHDELRTSGGNVCDWNFVDTPTPIFEVFAQGFYARGNKTAGDYLIEGVLCDYDLEILLVVSTAMNEVFLLRRDLVRIRSVGPQPAVAELSRSCHFFQNTSLPLVPFTIPGSATTWTLVDTGESEFQVQTVGDLTCWSVDCNKGVWVDVCDQEDSAQFLSVRNSLLQTKDGCPATFRGLLVTTWCEA